ncbi:MAG TPA: helix-turn-helix transcriptional regulator [Puia sp.]|nr:helix-turn-helix transcriptional regulator [Puia sp.]
MSYFAVNLRFLRKQRGLNQRDISNLFNKQGNTVGNWETGKSEPNIDELIRLADYFRIGLQDLLHQDLQQQALQAFDMTLGSGSPDNGNLPPVTGSSQEPNAYTQPHPNEAFWLILRELRAMNDKLEALVRTNQSAAPNATSDKSNH